MSSLRDLPRLLQAYVGAASDAQRSGAAKAIVEAIRAAPDVPPPVPAHVARTIQQRVDALEGPWPISVSKQHGAIPLCTDSALFHWSLRPDGVLLRSDLDSAMNNTEPATDPLVRFAMILRGVGDYPELLELLCPPRSALPCGFCLTTGRSLDFACPRCNGLGWISA